MTMTISHADDFTRSHPVLTGKRKGTTLRERLERIRDTARKASVREGGRAMAEKDGGGGMKLIEQYPVAWRVALIVLCFLLVGYFEWEGQELFNNMTPLSVEAER